MYTQCPQCATAFRVTADVLRQASGKVRCGSCSHTFNALAFLSETRPASRQRAPVPAFVPELKPESAPSAREPARPAMSAAQSAALLATLEQLAGENIRLEDTGVEWRLMGGDHNPAPNDDASAAARATGEYEAADEGDASEDDVIEISFRGLAPAFAGRGAAAATSAEAPGAAPARDAASHDASGTADFTSDFFADTNTPIESGVFLAATESRIDELLDDAPTPVDEFLTEAPNDVDAAEVFADGGSGPVEAQDVFADPATRPEDVLRFDDNTGLPDNFDFDGPSSPVPLPRPEPEPVADAPPAAEVVFGEPDEWVDLLEEVEPVLAAEPAPEREYFVDTGAHIAIGSAAGRRSAGSHDDHPPTLAEELAALPDDYDEDEPEAALPESGPAEDASATGSSMASLAIDLSGIYATPAPAEATGATGDRPLDDETSAEQLPDPFADPFAESADAALPPGDDEAAIPPVEFAAVPAEIAAASAADAEDASVEAASEGVMPDFGADADWSLALVPDDGTDEPAASRAPAKLVPDSTGELEFPLAEARRRDPDEPEFDPTRTIVPPPTEEEQTVNMLIDQDLMRLALTDDEGMTSTIVFDAVSGRKRKAGQDAVVPEPVADDSLFETIIMEGAFARTEFEQERLAAEARARAAENDAAPAQGATERAATTGGRRRRLQYGIIVCIVALVLALAGQIVHQSRADLATIPAVADAIAPIYRAVGAPITPEWNVKGWRFEVTRGSTDDANPSADDSGLPLSGSEVLTIRSRVGNTSGEALPYPLISVALTDRFEEVLGSRVLEPAEYLEAGADAGAMVPPGASFDAVIAVASPAEHAAGFKLNVCYREAGGELRCAIEDFR